ncbi:hypothetical protein N9993_01255 [bacterium]|jgi:hypothetical protein|nr:hypothetical protein [bacterium]
MSTRNTADTLQSLVDKIIPQYTLPYKEGKTIRIGKMLVRRSTRHGYIIVDTEDNATVSTADTKHGAVAIAKASLGGHRIDQLQQKDHNASKHLNDAMHYSYIIDRTNDENKKLMLEIRLEVAKSELESINTDLESYILKH